MFAPWSRPNRSDDQNQAPTSPMPPRRAVSTRPRVSVSSAMPTAIVPTSNQTMNEAWRSPRSAVARPATMPRAKKAGISKFHRGDRSSSRNTGRHHPRKAVSPQRALAAPTQTGIIIARRHVARRIGDVVNDAAREERQGEEHHVADEDRDAHARAWLGRAWSRSVGSSTRSSSGRRQEYPGRPLRRQPRTHASQRHHRVASPACWPRDTESRRCSCVALSPWSRVS